MDNTALTILGMIAAFITASVTAFLAEPVKNYFENKNKLKNLKIALYKEIIINYRILDGYATNIDDATGDLTTNLIIRDGIRTECYKHAIQNELTLFYQLPDSTVISILQNAHLNQLTNPPLLSKTYDKTKYPNALVLQFLSLSNHFLKDVATLFYLGKLDKDLLKDLVSTSEYKELMERGKENLEKETQTDPK